MPYIPHTTEDVREMLDTIGVSSIDDLFAEIPADLRLQRPLNIPSAKNESELYLHLVDLARQNLDATRLDWYLGAGIYDRYIPATVAAILSRGEFLTAYTPYQPELSQGYLQTIYEFQSMVAEIYGMDLANASMYDGATSLAEAAFLASAHTGRSKVAVSNAIHPHTMQVLETYCWANSIEIVRLPIDGGLTNLAIDAADLACLIVQTPNFYGNIEDLAAMRKQCDAAGCLMVVSANPVACALMKPPGEFGADIVVGEGQSLGVAMGFGGPLVGHLACKQEFVRKIPGRIVGRTVDANGTPGYTMTLRTREQDIRREKATSNICTNEALMALANTVYLAAMGKNGLRSVAESSVRNTAYAKEELVKAGAKLKFPNAKNFDEFVIELPKDAAAVHEKLVEKKIMAGLPLGRYCGGMNNCLLVAFTESRTQQQIDRFAKELASAIS